MMQAPRPTKRLRRQAAAMPDKPTVTPLEVARFSNGIVSLQLPDGRAILLQKVSGAPNGYSAVLVSDN